MTSEYLSIIAERNIMINNNNQESVWLISFLETDFMFEIQQIKIGNMSVKKYAYTTLLITKIYR